MKLSDFDSESFTMDIVNDGYFDYLGPFSKKFRNKLVFIQDEKNINNVIENIDTITCIICSSNLKDQIPQDLGIAISKNPALSFYKLHNYIAQENPYYQILPESFISQSADIHHTAFIDDNVTISARCTIHPNVTILKGTILEEDVIIGPGCVIGGKGLRYLRIDNEILPIAHVGGVILKKGVEIHSNSCIDKAVYPDYTIIGEYSKIGNQVQIAHNVLVGRKCIIAGCSMISGSTVIGDDVWIGPNATVSNNLTIGQSANITLGAVVTKNVPDDMTVSGNFAIEHSKFINFIKTIR